MRGYAESGRFRRLGRQAASLPALARLWAKVLHHVDRRVFSATRGRTTLTALLTGLPVVMLTTTGARSGQPRTVPVLGQPEGADMIVVASNFGQRHHPAWYHNLRAHPRATVVVGGARRVVEAQELTGEERERYYERGFRIYPAWRRYRDWAGAREIPVIRLSPVD
jgi:deazaflavin-dependent oxidoreductase (nitroreductase family)